VAPRAHSSQVFEGVVIPSGDVIYLGGESFAGSPLDLALPVVPPEHLATEEFPIRR
jgi:hypothetical protein